MSNFHRQNWNLSVAFLCFWLLVGTLIDAVNAIIWSDNREIRLYVYCDIVSHVRMIVFVVRPMATLLILRRLYMIASLQSVELPTRAMYVRNLIVEWTLGLLLPLIVAGPIYYINQLARFQVLEGFGCADSFGDTIVSILTLQTWGIIPPLLSVAFYYPRVLRTFWRRRKDGARFHRSVGSVSREHYLRVLALASIDLLITLPMGITNLVISITLGIEGGGTIPWYYGWAETHSGTGEPASIPYADLKAVGPSQLASTYFEQWSSPILAFAVFGLFGLTSQTRASYRDIIYTVGGWFGWKSTPREGHRESQMSAMEFRGQPEVSHSVQRDVDIGTRTSLISCNGTSMTYSGAEEKGRAGESGICDAEKYMKHESLERQDKPGSSPADMSDASADEGCGSPPNLAKGKHDPTRT
ncbi:unnamed protein product [Peniophora sp. CBMAI 1063]|nr:unnamed protein product [Peniophora sp. CBMAI 1063]